MEYMHGRILSDIKHAIIIFLTYLEKNFKKIVVVHHAAFVANMVLLLSTCLVVMYRFMSKCQMYPLLPTISKERTLQTSDSLWSSTWKSPFCLLPEWNANGHIKTVVPFFLTIFLRRMKCRLSNTFHYFGVYIFLMSSHFLLLY